MGMDTCRMVLADDHALFREGLRRLLEEKHDLRVVGEANDGKELLDLLERLQADLILLDISMPNERGLDVIPEIRKNYPSVKILILTAFNDREFVYRAMAIGANGYSLKQDAGPELLSAIDQVRQGRTYVAPYFSNQAGVDWEELRRGVQKSALTARENEILKLIAEGKSNKEIAEDLFISFFTVKRHRANIMEKLDLRNVSDLVKYAIQKTYI
jgi:DNA-binding NarL/FixJ family response regulator